MALFATKIKKVAPFPLHIGISRISFPFNCKGAWATAAKQTTPAARHACFMIPPITGILVSRLNHEDQVRSTFSLRLRD